MLEQYGTSAFGQRIREVDDVDAMRVKSPAIGDARGARGDLQAPS